MNWTDYSKKKYKWPINVWGKKPTSLAIRKTQIKTKLRFHLTLVRKAITKETNDSKDKKRNPYILLVEMQISAAPKDIGIGAPQRAKTRTTYPAIPILNVCQKACKVAYHRDKHTSILSLLYSQRWIMESAEMPINRWMMLGAVNGAPGDSQEPIRSRVYWPSLLLPCMDTTYSLNDRTIRRWCASAWEGRKGQRWKYFLSTYWKFVSLTRSSEVPACVGHHNSDKTSKWWKPCWAWCHRPVILAPGEVEVERSHSQSQPGKLSETLYWEKE